MKIFLSNFATFRQPYSILQSENVFELGGITMAYNPRRPMKTLEFFLSIDPVFNTADRKLGPNCLKIQLNPAVFELAENK